MKLNARFFAQHAIVSGMALEEKKILTNENDRAAFVGEYANVAKAYGLVETHEFYDAISDFSRECRLNGGKLTNHPDFDYDLLRDQCADLEVALLFPPRYMLQAALEFQPDKMVMSEIGSEAIAHSSFLYMANMCIATVASDIWDFEAHMTAWRRVNIPAPNGVFAPAYQKTVKFLAIDLYGLDAERELIAASSYAMARVAGNEATYIRFKMLNDIAIQGRHMCEDGSQSGGKPNAATLH